MKIFELEKVLKVEKDDDKETTLVDPQTGTKTIIDKTKNPNAVQSDQTGKLVLNKNGQQTSTGQAKNNLMGKTVAVADDIDRIRELAGLQQEAGQPTVQDMGNGRKKTTYPDGTYDIADASGITKYSADGKVTAKTSPTVQGYSQTSEPSGKVTSQSYSSGPLNVKKNADGASQTDYDLGTAKIGTKTSSVGTRTNTTQIR